MGYKTIAVRPKVYGLIEDCETIYREYHPEFNELPISKDKIIYEICKFYLLKTKLKVLE